MTGVLNHWSENEVADLHAADLTLQDALSIAPGSMKVRGAQCHILRAMRQYEAAIKACSELAQSFPEYAFLHKEVGYDRLMMGQPNEALAEFLEADRLQPNSQLRWSWQQGIGLVYLMQGQDQKAIEWLARAALEAPNAANPVAYLAWPMPWSAASKRPARPSFTTRNYGRTRHWKPSGHRSEPPPSTARCKGCWRDCGWRGSP